MSDPVMTSLALQLKQLAVPHTAVSLVADKKRVSLLFDPKEAANLDREAVFALGTSGLDALKKTDEEFHKFEALLFNEGSSTWERSLQSAEINQTLDKQIEQFLVRLSPYFLLKAAHRTLEWLIFKYHIHLYNVDPLIQCALPYHDSKIFVQLISLLKISLSTNKWHWLHPSATSGAPLPKAVIIAHCRKNHAFLRFLYNMVENFIKEHGADSANVRSVVSLYTSAVMGCVCEKQYISEALLAGLVPILILGIRSCCAELKVGTYACVTLLATQTELEPEFVQNLLHTLFKYPAESLVREVLSCLIAIFHTQNIEDIKDSTYFAITKLPGFIEQFSLINEEFECSKVLLLLMNHVISGLSTDVKNNQDLCINIIHEIKFSPEVAEQLACTLLSHILKLANAKKRWKSIATRLLPIMEQRYPEAMDSAIKSIYKSLSSSQDEVYHEILQCSFRDSDSRSDNSRSFLLTINHPSCERRCISIRTLRSGLKNTDKQLPENISEVIVAHFLDDDMNTVLEALKLTTHISQSLKTKDLVSHLLVAFDNAVSRNWFDVKSAALEHLTHGRFTCDVDIQIMSHMFPYVCLRKVKDKETAIEILTSKLFLKYLPDHEDWRSSLEACRKVRSFNNAVVQKLSSWMLEMKYFLRKSLLDMKLHEKSCAPNPTCSVVVVMLAGTKACCHGNGRETALISMLVQLLKDSSRYVKEDSEVSDVELPYEDLLHGFDTNVLVQAIKWCTRQLGKLSQDVQGIFLDSTDYFMQCHIHLLNAAVEITQQTTNPAVCKIWVELIQNYVTEDAISPREVHQILCWFILYGYRLTSIHDVTITPVLQIASIGMLQKHLSRKNILEAVEIERSPVFVTLFSCISHPQKCMREKAVDILRKIKKHKLSKWKVISPVLRAIVTQREELINDETFSAHFLLPIIQAHPETLTYFMTVVTSDDYPLEVKERMMYLIQDVQLHDVETCEKFCSIGISILSKERVSLPVERSMLAIIFNGFVKKNAMHMQSDSRMFKLLATAIRTDWRAFNIPEDVDSPLDMILRKITRKLFAKIPSQKEKKRIITLLLDAVMRSRSAKLTQSITGILTDLDLQYADVNHYLPSGEASQEVTVREKRKSQPQEVDWERVTLLLEILQDRTSFSDAESIMMAAFLVLQRLLEDTRIGEESEYKKRLALTVIHNLARKWAEKQQQPKLKTIRMEVLTQCLRNSTILTQQQTLLVVTQVCFFYPEYVLDNVMSIFTFMGSGILRLDNIYSFNVIIEVVRKLLPALLEAHRNNNEIVLHIENDSSENAKESVIVSDVVQVFVEARPVIPRHRALSIFEALVSTIGPRDFLWQVVALLIQGGARGSAVTLANEDQIIVKRTDDEDEDSSSAYLKDSSSFAIELTLMFTVDEQLHSLYTMLQFLIKLTDIQAAVCSNKTAKPDISTQAIIQHLNPKQLRLFQFYLTKHIANVLGDTVFIEKVVEAMSVTHMLNFDLLVEKTMSYNSVTTKHCNQSSQKHHTSYWSSLQKRTNAILNKLNYLLPLDKLLSVLEQLLLTGALAVKRKTLELLAEKLRSLSVENLTEAEEKQLLNMTELIVKEGVDQSTEFMKQTGKHSSELLHYHQLMLYNAKLLAKHLGAKYPNVFKPFMAICVKLIGPQTQTRVLCTALLGVAQLCSVLSQHVIVYLKDFVPAIHEIMKEHNLLKGNETVLSSVLTALHHLYGSLASFLSPYLKDTLILISSLSTIVNVNDPQKQLSDPVQRLRATRRLIGQGINPRVLLPILGETFDELLTTDASSVSSLLELIKDHMEHITKEDIDNQHHTIFDLFYKTLDVRNSAAHMSHEDISIIESTVIDAFVILVKKMSEDSFKPEFLKVYDWCCREDDIENRNRKLTFFALTYRLSQTLTSLFNLFVGVTFGAACKTLDANNSKLHKVRYYGKGEKAKKKSCALVSVILKSLDSCLSFDADGLITPEMYKIMGTPLVNQLENLLGGDEEYNTRTVSALIPCLSQFAVVSKHAGKSNHFNAAVGEKTKSGHPKVRIAAIRVMEATALKMGHEYMKLLPEIAPLLHELMEDENEEVEDQCQRTVNVMEQAVGENLRNYF